MDDAQTEETALQAAMKRKERLINYVMNADERRLNRLRYFCKFHNISLFDEPATGIDGEAT